MNFYDEYVDLHFWHKKNSNQYTKYDVISWIRQIKYEKLASEYCHIG